MYWYLNLISLYMKKTVMPFTSKTLDYLLSYDRVPGIVGVVC